jgi:hypothetical protein
MCPAGYPEKHAPRSPLRHERDQPVPLLSRVLGPPPNLDSKPPHLRPGLKVVLRPSPIPASNQSVRKKPEPMKESNKAFRSHKRVCAQDNKSVTWPGVQCNERSLIDVGGTNATRASLGLSNQVHIQFQVQSHPVSNYYPYIIHVIVT